jgi:hypothetical protein
MRPTKIKPKNDIKRILFTVNCNGLTALVTDNILNNSVQFISNCLRAESTARGTTTGTAKRDKNKNTENKT